MKTIKTLAFLNHDLSDPAYQLEVLNEQPLIRFEERLRSIGMQSLQPTGLDILQVNLGKMCNQTCSHCHVDAGPDRKEIMERHTMEQCLAALDSGNFQTLDLTGGAPEMNPWFREFVIRARPKAERIIVRSNLTIIVSNRKYHDLPEFFREQGLEVVSSLPCYTESNTDAQRGSGVFRASIRALHMLNEAGYGQQGTGLVLNLVYNPGGAFLPGSQDGLQKDYKRHLLEHYGILFNELFTITNMPISRFLEYLVKEDRLEDYMELLSAAFNPAAADGLMCRNTVSVGWDGSLYDCDFNQMLDMKSKGCSHIAEFHAGTLLDRQIRTDQHCFGCTAGAGSSCGGAIA